MTSKSFSLRTASLSSVVWLLTVPVGWALIAIGVWQVVATASSVQNAPAFAMIAGLVVILELLPLVQGRGHDPQGVVMSTAFVCAMLFMWGPWPAILAAAVASLASDLRAGKQWWKVLFNPAQYAASFACAGLAMFALHGPVSLDHQMHVLSLHDLGWVPITWIVYFVVNDVLVSAVLSYDEPFLELIKDDVVNYATITFAVMALSPLVVVVGQHAWALLPVMLVPLLLLYHTAAMSLEREHAAGHDTLTGLPNRATLEFELESTLASYRRDGTAFCLMLIDMDDFKRVNDTLGHQVGDRLLVHFADRLNERLRPGDLVARLGGDEFAVIVAESDVDGARMVAERLREHVADSIDVGGLSLEVDISIGIAVCPDHGTDGTTLLRHADVAMYNAKEHRSRVEVYTPERDMNTADRLALLGELRQALATGAIELHYQPKVAARDLAPIGMEALVRWPHPQRGFIPPDEFVPLAERSGIMPLLTERVIRLALNQVAEWSAEGITVQVAVNIAPTDLIGDELASVIAQALVENRVAPGLLKLEITERIVTHQLDSATRNIDRLRAMGVAISLDDFGTGYSSMLRLSALDVDEIKIDRGFVSGLSGGARAVAIVRTLVELAHALGMPAVAEGVETAEELEVLQSLDCDGIQGWHISRPMPAAAATAWLRANDRPVPFVPTGAGRVTAGDAPAVDPPAPRLRAV